MALEVSGIDHVVLHVRDVERSKKFYMDLLGMTWAHGREGQAFLRCGSQMVALFAVDGDDHALFGELIDGACLGDRHLNARLQHRRGEHEDEQKHKDDVDQRSDVDLGQCGLGASFGGEGHC